MEAEQDVFCLKQATLCCSGYFIHSGYRDKAQNYRNKIKRLHLTNFISCWFNLFVSDEHYAKKQTLSTTSYYIKLVYHFKPCIILL